MKVLISGSTGLVGKNLASYLEYQGHEVYSLVRSESKLGPRKIFWQPDEAVLDTSELEGFDVVVHLAGENIADRRWTTAQKTRILESRTKSTHLLASTLAKLKAKPNLFISASAIGYYADRPFETLYEHSFPVEGLFISDTCKAWEAAADPAREAGIRVVHPRIGIVLSKEGGALAKLVLPFSFGMGGDIGSGKQIMSWISIEDLIYGLYFIMNNSKIKGPVNFTSPHPVTNSIFTSSLARVLGRPALAPMPSFLAKIIFGEMADALLLASAKVKPKVLEDAGYKFTHPRIEECLRSLVT
ncbi:MAG: TIGR01777 family oxidoreductase [Candidatus Melainabacteria bacterium]|nr:TIGR01777 family oxidoreductase [Candidatus Melainabacteria bacterium]